MLDWTEADGRAVLWAQLPYRGRALPLCAAVQNWKLAQGEERREKAEQDLLCQLRRVWPQDAPPPLLLADRGFARSGFLQWLLEQEWLFLIRGRQGIYVYDGPHPAAREMWDDLQAEPGQVKVFERVYYSQTARVAVSLVVCCQLDPTTGKPAQWWLLTNLPEEHRRRAPRLYAQRMQPEGVHRDSKRGHAVGGFALSHLGRLRKDRLQRLVGLLSLVYCFLVLVAETERETRAWLCRKHWGLALPAFGLALLQAAGKSARHLVQQACASVKLQPLWLQGGDS